jgi:Mrp family chromosome partitioning ATPase
VAPLVDGVLLVVQRANAGREAVRSACRELASIGARMVGVVVSRANEGPGHRYYGYYGYYRMPDATPRRDRLTKINGIDSVYEKALNALGIVSFAQLAEQDPDTLAEKMDVLASATPIRRDRWIEQAQAFLHSQEHV